MWANVVLLPFGFTVLLLAISTSEVLLEELS